MSVQSISPNQLCRWFYCFSGILCVVLAIFGVILPLLPTTPFLILAALLFSKSSHKLHQLLLNNRVFGGLIHDWENHGVIPLKAKLLSSSMMLAMVSYSLYYRDFHVGLKLLVVFLVLFSIVYVWSRPSKPILC